MGEHPGSGAGHGVVPQHVFKNITTHSQHSGDLRSGQSGAYQDFRKGGAEGICALHTRKLWRPHSLCIIPTKINA